MSETDERMPFVFRLVGAAGIFLLCVLLLVGFQALHDQGARVTYWAVVFASFVAELVKGKTSTWRQLLLHVVIGASLSGVLFLAGVRAAIEPALSESENFARSLGFGVGAALWMVLINRLIRFGFRTIRG